MNRLWVISILFVTSKIFAATFSDGVRAYQQGDFKKSESALTEALKTTKNPKTRAEIFKYLGMTQWSLKSPAKATGSFSQARALNPTVSISNDEVLDPGVIGFFEKDSGKQASSQPVKSGMTRGSGAKAKAQPTTLFIDSNVKNASVVIGGILVGQTQSQLDVDGGAVLLEVSAPGYQKKIIKTKIQKSSANHLTVDLEKRQAKPVAKVAAVPILNSAAKPKVGRQIAVAKKPVQDDMFKEASDPLPTQPVAAPTTVTQLQSLPPPPVMQPQPQGYAVQPALPYQLPPVIYQQPVYTAPPPMYPQPYPQQYPSMYQQPYQPPYQQPYDPNMTGSSIPPLPQQNPANYNYASPQQNNSGAGNSLEPKKKVRPRGSPFLAILPFGAGQFQNQSYLKGTLLLGAEVGALYFWKANTDAADQATKQLDTDSADFDNQIVSSTDPATKTYYQNQKAARQTELQDYIKTSNNNAMMSLGAFGGFYLIGVVDAFIFMSDGPPPVKKKKRRRSGFSLDLKHLQNKNYIAVQMSVDNKEENLMQFGLGATPRGELMLGVKVDL